MKTVSFSQQVQSALEFSNHLMETTLIEDSQLQFMRNFYRRMAVMAGERQQVFMVEDRKVKSDGLEVPIRIYRPSAKVDLPVTIYFHGGWFFMGDLESHDIVLRALTNEAESVVIAVDYRLAPENPFPAAIIDARAVLNWVAQNAIELGIDGTRIAVAGDSAGGAIATTTARLAAHSSVPKLLLQVLIYPVTDSSLNTPSWGEFEHGPVIEKKNAAGAWGMYVPDEKERQNPDAAPLYATNFDGVAPAFIIAAEGDPLRDEVIAYSEKLKSAGINVKDSLYRGMPHGFFQLGGYIDDAKKAITEVAGALKEAFNR